MIFAQTGTVETYIFSEQKALTNWSITISGKSGREKTTTNVAMAVLYEADRRYKLEWTCPVLSQIEYDYEVLSDTTIIDKGILRHE